MAFEPGSTIAPANKARQPPSEARMVFWAVRRVAMGMEISRPMVNAPQKAEVR